MYVCLWGLINTQHLSNKFLINGCHWSLLANGSITSEVAFGCFPGFLDSLPYVGVSFEWLCPVWHILTSSQLAGLQLSHSQLANKKSFTEGSTLQILKYYQVVVPDLKSHGLFYCWRRHVNSQMNSAECFIYWTF